MIYRFFSLIVLFFVIGQIDAQSINNITIDPDLDTEILIGRVDETGLTQDVFVSNWEDRYLVYIPDKVAAKKIKKFFRKNKDLSIIVFFGSWCGDSQEHLPDFVKLAHQTKMKNVTYFALNRQKNMDDLDFIQLDNYQIEKVPTFIVFQNNKEIGRIIETPKISLEKDILKILESHFK